jgi:SAM-dependent methyltransferase
VIEIGSRDVNGSLRQIVEQYGPQEYVGVDIDEGPGVDVICDVSELAERFGKESFDVVLSTEMIEHVRDWRGAISQFKNILRPNGMLLVTTRSKGFPYHDYPSDFWRFEIEDMKDIFSDMVVEAVEPDTSEPGVFVKANKPEGFKEKDLGGYALYSIITDRKSRDIGALDMFKFKLKKMLTR